MKKVSQLLAALVFCSLVVFMSCGGDDSGSGKVTIDDIDKVGAALEGSWEVTDAKYTADGGSQVTRDEWTDATTPTTLSFSYNESTNSGTLSASNVPQDPGADGVFATTSSYTLSQDASGSNFTFTINGNTYTAVLDDAENPTTMTVSFNVTGADQSARVATFDGAWVFTLAKQ